MNIHPSMTIKTSAYWRKEAFYPRFTVHAQGTCIYARTVEYACMTREEAIEKAEEVVKTARVNMVV